ncbi:MAG: hypothetical protein LBL00_07840 [Endomicrobium sp.]|nr:hypothetical protein [Endomicrobium sp.]
MNINKTDICNSALMKFADESIENVDSNYSERGRRLRLVYEQTLRKVLESANWNFAKSFMRLQLIQLSEDEFSKYRFCYAYPDECVYIRKLIAGSRIYKFEDYKHRDIFLTTDGRKAISCNICSNLIIEYTRYVDKPHVYSAGFVNALVNRLAYEVCYSSSGKSDKAAEFLQVYQMEVDTAIANSLNEDDDDEKIHSESLKAHRRAYDDLP